MSQEDKITPMPLVWPLEGTPPQDFHGIDSSLVLYAIGDIHGRLDLLEELLALIDDDISASKIGTPAKLIFLGDYIDRGLQSAGVIDRLMELQSTALNSVFLRGNHEQAALDFITDKQSGSGWLSVGGAETCFSYGVKVSPANLMGRDLSELQFSLRNALPKEHLAFLMETAFLHTEGDYLFVHAGINPKAGLKDQTSDDLIWIRRPFLDSSNWHGKLVIHGHSIDQQVQVRSNRIGIDTGAYLTGVLTALKIDSESMCLLQTGMVRE